MATVQEQQPKQAPEVNPERESRGLAAAAGELVLAMLSAALVSLVIQFVVNRLPIAVRSNVGSVVIMLGAGAALAVLAVVLLARWRDRLSLLFGWLALPAAATVTLSATLGGTRYYLGGVTNDQSFRMEYLTRMAASPRLSDFAYAGIPPYYPAGWFWLGGRFANLFGLAGWAAFKPFAILTVAVASAICCWLWSRSVSRRTALLLATMSTVIGLTLGSTDSTVAVTEPYSWLAVLTIPPLMVLAWRALEAQRARRPAFSGYRMVAAVGLLTGVYAATYTLYFGFTVLILVLLVGAVLLRHRRSDGPDAAAMKTLVLRTLRLAVVTAVGALVVILPVWTPYLLGMLSGTQGTNDASHFLPPVGASFPTPFLEVTPIGLLCLLGLGWLVVAVLTGSRYRTVACGLAVIVAAAYLWYTLSALSLGLRTSLLAFRIEPILVTALITAAGLAVLECLRLVRTRLDVRWQPVSTVLPALIGSALLLTQLQDFPRTNPRVLSEAFHDYYPDTGRTPMGVANPADADYWTPQLTRTIDELSTGGEPVVLGSDPKLLFATNTYWRFQATTPHYANPLADYQRRNALLQDWSATADSAALHAKLAASPVVRPTVFVLSRSPRDPDTLTARLARDIFPQNPNVAFTPLVFHRTQFTDPAFTLRDVGPFTVVAVRY